MAIPVDLRTVPYPDEQRIPIRMPGRLKGRLERLALGDSRSLNGEIVRALMEWATQAEIRQRVEREMLALDGDPPG